MKLKFSYFIETCPWEYLVDLISNDLILITILEKMETFNFVNNFLVVSV